MTKGEKMLSTLGYERQSPLFDEKRRYVKVGIKSTLMLFFQETNVRKDGYCKTGHTSRDLTYDEIIACAEIVKEMQNE